MKHDTAMHEPGPSSGAPAAAVSDTASPIVSLVSADRMCIGCGHNLYGQHVLRELHYGLLIARCPECGAVASMQEYPVLGRWAGRLGMALAALCLLLAIAVVFGSAMALGGMSYGIGDEFGRSLTDSAQLEFDRWAASVAQGASGPQPARFRDGPEGQRWWTEQGGFSGFVASRGGWLAILDWRTALLWIPAAMAATAIGCFWSVALLGLPRRRLWKPACLLLVLAIGAVVFIVLVETTGRRTDTWMSLLYVQRRLFVGGGMALVTLAVLAPFLAAGLWLGRPMARGAVKLFLPPRFRGPLSSLLRAD